MNTIKTFLKTEFKILSILILLSASSCFLLMARIKLTHSFYFLFLVWNLFLAGIPYLISSYLSSRKKTNTFFLLLTSSVWLLFLPNAPYIITDLFHLQYSSSHLIWIDTLVIVAFAITGVLLCYKSVLTMETLYKNHFKKGLIHYCLPLLFIIVSFGIYLGRFLRFNSWEIINKPSILFQSILDIVTQPRDHSKAWLFSFAFGLFLYVGYFTFKKLNTK